MSIPKIIFQTSPTFQPQYVIDMIKEKAPDWEYRHFTDKEIIQYFINNPVEEFPFILNKFTQMKFGAHKADLFRYYFLYVEGGVFLDSDAMIQTELENITKNYEFFSVNSYIKGTIFQGFLGATPRNKIIYEALKDAYYINVGELTKHYHLLTANMYTIIYNNHYDFEYKLYRELESDEEKAATVNENDEVILIHYWKTKIVPLNHNNNMHLMKNTIYINLEHRKDRLEHVTKELSKLGIIGERLNAVKTKNGAIGCTLSHIKCLEMAKERNYDYVFICEDDITFLKPDILKDSLKKFYEDTNIDWDVLLIGGNNVPPYEKTRDYCIRVSNCQTTTGYIAKRQYYDTLISNFRDSVQGLIKTSNKKMYALDIYWKGLQRINNWYMLFPFTVTQCEGYSDIEEQVVDYHALMLDADKEWLFKRQNNMVFR